jgi:hypothetical protein
VQLIDSEMPKQVLLASFRDVTTATLLRCVTLRLSRPAGAAR